MAKGPGKGSDKQPSKPVLAFSDVLSVLGAAQALPAPPAVLPWAGSLGPGADWQMLQNDVVGDCTIAAACHMLMAWSDRTRGAPWSFEKDARADFDLYKTAPGGSLIANILEAWQAFGIHRRDANDVRIAEKIDRPALLNINDKAQLKTQAMQAIQLLGGCYLGVILPKFSATVSADGNVHGDAAGWSKTAAEIDAEGPAAAKNPKAAHAVNAIGYGAAGLQVVTWGRAVDMSWDFFLRYTTEAWAIVCTDAWVGANDLTPSGLTLAQLRQDFAALRKAGQG